MGFNALMMKHIYLKGNHDHHNYLDQYHHQNHHHVMWPYYLHQDVMVLFDLRMIQVGCGINTADYITFIFFLNSQHVFARNVDADITKILVIKLIYLLNVINWEEDGFQDHSFFIILQNLKALWNSGDKFHPYKAHIISIWF